MGEFRMPSLGADMEEGTLVEWMVAEGDRVARGDIVAAVDTDKATIDVEVFEDGVVERLLVEPGAVLPVGAPLAFIADDAAGDGSGAPAQDTHPVEDVGVSSPPAEVTSTRHGVDAEPVNGGADHHHASLVLSPLVRHLAERLGLDAGSIHGTGVGGRVTRSDVERAARPVSASRRSSPRARRRALELGVELTGVRGTGPGGAIRERDVLESVRLPAAEPTGEGPKSGGETEIPGRNEDRKDSMRRAIARTMSRSNREIPHYHLDTTIDLQAAETWLAEYNDGRPPGQRLLSAALLLRATALAAVAVPQLNGFWIDGRFEPGTAVHLGVAVSLRGGGLIAPVIRDAADHSVAEIMASLRDLVARGRQGTLRGSEIDGATMTVTNLGDRGVDSVHGIIHPPQVALVGVGRISTRAMVVEGRVVPRASVVLSLAADHRASDGQVGSRFLNRMDSLLQHPDAL